MDEPSNLKDYLISPVNSNIKTNENIQLTPKKTRRKLSDTLSSSRKKQTLLSPNEHIDYKDIMCKLCKSAIPCILSLTFIFLYDNLNIIFANEYLGQTAVSAVGVGNFYVNATGFILGLGLLGGVDTLCSQAFGAKKYYLMGLYVNISRIVLIGFFIFGCLPFVLASEYILNLINQPQEIIELTSDHIQSMIPSIFFALQFYASKSYLQAMNIYLPGMLITFITAVLHSLWLFLFLGVFKLDIKGIGYSMGVTHLLNFIIITAYIHNNNPNGESYFCFDPNSISLKRILDYLKLAVPSAIIFSADYLGFHVLVLYASYIDLTCLIVNVAAFNFMMLIFSIPMGFSYATCMYVGMMMGSNKVNTARVYTHVATLISTISILALAFVILYFQDYFPYIYTDDAKVAQVFSELLPVIFIFAIFDSFQIIFSGILKGLGKQKPASLLALIILYPITVPMSLTLAFTLNYKLNGLWYSHLTAVIFLDFSYLIMILCLDWETNALRTIVNIDKISIKLIKKALLLDKIAERDNYTTLPKGKNK